MGGGGYGGVSSQISVLWGFFKFDRICRNLTKKGYTQKKAKSKHLRKELIKETEDKRPDININANEKLAVHCGGSCRWCLGILWCH